MSYMDTPEQRRRAKQISNEIDAQIQKEKAAMAHQNKGPRLLLLGAGDSGKTTVLKQMKIIHGEGFNEKDRLDYRQRAMSNILDSMRCLLEGMETLEIPLELLTNKAYANLINSNFNRTADGLLPMEVFQAIRSLWNDEGVQAAYARRNEFFIQDTADYFFNNLDRFMIPNYFPTDQDILFTRFRTTQVTETKFNIDNLVYSIFDVGGQQSLRVYWAPYFESNLNAIIFVASLASYDQLLVEDGKTNRLQDSISLFEQICNHDLLVSSNIILFLNKADLMEAKIRHSPLKKHFPDYDDSDARDQPFKSACRFIKDMFLSQNRIPEKKIYTHFTTGTDTANMKVIISAVRDIVTRNALKQTGMLA